MAREVAAILGKKLKDPAKLGLLPAGPAAVQSAHRRLRRCARDTARWSSKMSRCSRRRLWLQYRLTAIGLNPINNIVDMTNFVMAELAQPMHAFDADLLQGDTIFVRPAKAGERFRALNDEEYTLEPSNLVIADAAGRHRAGRRDRRRRQRHQRAHHPRGAREREFPGLVACARLRPPSSCAPTPPCASRKRRTRSIRVRGLARAVELLRELSPGIRLVGGLADAEDRHAAAAARSSCRSTGWSGNWAARSRRRKCATSWSAWNSA